MPIVLVNPMAGEPGDPAIVAVIADGEVIEGEFDPSPRVDLADEAALWKRYANQAMYATWVAKADLGTYIGESNQSDDSEEESSGREDKTIYQCTVCDLRYTGSGDGPKRGRWMYCVECEKDRLWKVP